MWNYLQSLGEAERRHLLDCFGTVRKKAAKGQAFFREGDPATRFGIVVSGSVNVVRYSADGREKLLAHLPAGEAFGTTFVLAEAPRYFADIEAAESSEALLLRGERVLNPCEENCPAHARFLSVLLKTIAERNIMLARKIECLTERKTSEKVMSYLRMQAELSGGRSFTIPFTRQQLADYLNVDRTALCTEIGRLTRKGLVRTTGKAFSIGAEGGGSR